MHSPNLRSGYFGNQQQLPLFTDSRRVDDFGTILENIEAIRYLEDNKKPDFDYAFQLAGGDESNIAQLPQRGSNQC